MNSQPLYLHTATHKPYINFYLNTTLSEEVCIMFLFSRSLVTGYTNKDKNNHITHRHNFFLMLNFSLLTPTSWYQNWKRIGNLSIFSFKMQFDTYQTSSGLHNILCQLKKEFSTHESHLFIHYLICTHLVKFNRRTRFS